MICWTNDGGANEFHYHLIQGLGSNVFLATRDLPSEVSPNGDVEMVPATTQVPPDLSLLRMWSPYPLTLLYTIFFPCAWLCY